MWFIWNGKTIFTRIKLRDIVGDNFDRHSSRSPRCCWIKISLNGNLNSVNIKSHVKHRIFSNIFTYKWIHFAKKITKPLHQGNCLHLLYFNTCEMMSVNYNWFFKVIFVNLYYHTGISTYFAQYIEHKCLFFIFFKSELSSSLFKNHASIE